MSVELFQKRGKTFIYFCKVSFKMIVLIAGILHVRMYVIYLVHDSLNHLLKVKFRHHFLR